MTDIKTKFEKENFFVDFCSGFVYDNISDRVADTCEDCDQKRLPREPFFIQAETTMDEKQHYLNATKYNYTPINQDDVNELITRLTKITNDPKNYPYIKHQKKQHGNIPLRVMMKALTLGTVSKMYSFLPQSIQYNVSKEFDYVHEGMLVQIRYMGFAENWLDIKICSKT